MEYGRIITTDGIWEITRPPRRGKEDTPRGKETVDFVPCRKEGRTDGSKEVRKDGWTEGRTEVRKEGRLDGRKRRKEGRKEGKEGRKVGRKEGRKGGRK